VFLGVIAIAYGITEAIRLGSGGGTPSPLG
jgi:hypothetical protein